MSVSIFKMVKDFSKVRREDGGEPMAIPGMRQAILSGVGAISLAWRDYILL
ncbi:hypothetical protein [Intestinirhabdus alba]|jgi:hypothetical protein|uniref:Uncharacterized protein n=1 Tax=Intestinirhabdus alba TaxID=2899544 RepID=A0A6L6IJD6_9ENTR|nr:hypothetical protein [Intestinirhabdus alba]MTH45716.1 hypothetical protein [Intestinirhabdus alba]